jgi:cell division inhibitor SepF
MSAWKKAMFYLGLGPDDAYEDEPFEPERPPVRAQRPATSYGDEVSGTVRAIPPRAATRESQPQRGPVATDTEPPAVTIRPRQSGSSAVRTVSGVAQSRPHTVRPSRFDHAQEVGDRFKDGQAVIVNLQDVDANLLRRLIDFCSGLCYALGGTMEKVAVGVYLLTPANVSVSPEDRQAMAEQGYHA